MDWHPKHVANCDREEEDSGATPQSAEAIQSWEGGDVPHSADDRNSHRESSHHFAGSQNRFHLPIRKIKIAIIRFR